MDIIDINHMKNFHVVKITIDKFSKSATLGAIEYSCSLTHGEHMDSNITLHLKGYVWAGLIAEAIEYGLYHGIHIDTITKIIKEEKDNE